MSRESARDYVFNRDVVLQPDRLGCTSPVELAAIGLPSQFEGGNALPFTLTARCRKCEACLAHRRRLWTARAVDEIEAARRTWFGTLTVSPEQRFALTMRAEKARLRAGRETVSSLTAPEQFELLSSELGSEVTKWLKRVRDVAPGPLRYLLVMEAHKDGFPHAHILVHEVGEPIAKRMLQAKWRFGFSHFKLVGDDPGAATYVCKYLAKDALARVRASQHYGRAAKVRALTERLQSMRDTILRARQEQEATIVEGPTQSGESGFQKGGVP